MKILITGGTSALAHKIIRAFAGHEIVLADYGEVPALPSSSINQLISLGVKNEEITAHQLLSICLDNNIDLIVPLHSFEFLPLSKSKVLYTEFNIEIGVPNPDLLPHHLHEGVVDKNNWIVLYKGEVIFSQLEQVTIALEVKSVQLSGAYYLDVKDNALRLMSC